MSNEKSKLDELLDRVEAFDWVQGGEGDSPAACMEPDIDKLVAIIRAYHRHLERIAAADESNPLARWARRGLRNGDAIAGGTDET